MERRHCYDWHRHREKLSVSISVDRYQGEKDVLFSNITEKTSGRARTKIRNATGLYYAGGIKCDHRQRKAVGRHGSGIEVSDGICRWRKEDGNSQK